ncbi:MAG: hypothetical protein JWN32_218, partial [Solirubrobacterales bacterium]|nr:hypothetical protein [Solirubrobacterales bacterium]
MSGSFDPNYAGAPRIERVEVAPGGVAGLLVRVEGRWSQTGERVPKGAVLLVRGDRRQFRFPALPAPEPTDGVWRATFSVPADLRAALDRELVLELGSLAIRLPAPGPGATVSELSSG